MIPNREPFKMFKYSTQIITIMINYAAPVSIISHESKLVTTLVFMGLLK